MIRDILRDAYDDFSMLVILNLLWALTTVLVITAPAGAAGLYYAGNQMAHYQPVGWQTFFEGFRRYCGLGYRWALVNLITIFVMFYSYWFYGQYPAGWAVWVRGLVLGITVLWLLLQVYTFPLLYEQKDRRMRVALRNSMVLYLKRPGLGLGLVLLLASLVALSTVLVIPWLLFTASLFVYLTSRVTAALVDELQGPGLATPPAD